MTTPVVLPRNLAANPALHDWVDLSTAGCVCIGTGKVELGQGIITALAQIAAEELDVLPQRVKVAAARTDRSPREGFTAGSMSITDSGAAVRHACRQVRAVATARAARLAETGAAELTVVDGTFCAPGGRAVGDYWTLVAESDELGDATASEAAAPLMTTQGPIERIDLPDKVFGNPRFIHDLVLPAMVHGRVVRPPSPGAHLRHVDADAVRRLPHVVQVVVDGEFLAVVAEREDAAVQAVQALRDAAVWQEKPGLPQIVAPQAWLREEPTNDTLVVEDAAEPLGAADYVATYSRPYLAHASIAPSCAIAHATTDLLHVWTHSQGIFELRDALAQALHLTPEKVVVEHVEGAGCYGHNPADDAAADAAMLALEVPGRPVRVQWERADEFGWDPFGSAMTADVRARLQDGRVSDWSYDVWSSGHTSRPGYGGPDGGLLGCSHRASGEPLPASVDPSGPQGHGTARNADPGYAFDRRRVTSHRLHTMPVRTSALRSLGAFFNVFAIESSMDDLAALAQSDPVEFRLAHLRDERAKGVVRAAAEAAEWPTRRRDGAGRGIAYARYKNRGAYCAVVADVEATHELRVTRLVVAVDVGRVVSDDGVRNQIEGGAIQATSWALKEQVGFDDRTAVTTDWESYPILRFSEVPHVQVHVLDRPDQPSLGAGEAVQAPVPAAIANALHDALGVRVRDLPLNTEHIIAAIDQ